MAPTEGPFSAVAGISVRVQDGLGLDYTVAWSPGSCADSGPMIRCRSESGWLRGTFWQRPSGPGQSILIGFQAHSTCYACHTAESKIGSCSVCHQLTEKCTIGTSAKATSAAIAHRLPRSSAVAPVRRNAR